MRRIKAASRYWALAVLMSMVILPVLEVQPAGAAGPDPQGTIYVSDGEANAIDVFAPGSSGNVAPERVIQGADTGLDGPTDVKVDPSGDVWASNFSNDSITEYAPGASGDASPICTISGSNTGLDQNDDMSLEPDGTIVVGNFTDAAADGGSVEVFAPGSCGNVAPVETIEGSNAGFNTVDGVGTDAAGTIFADSTDDDLIDVFPAGSSGNVAPEYTISGSNTGLGTPDDVVVGFDGQLYVTSGFSGVASVTVYPSGASGNATPIQDITGSTTDLGSADDLAVDSSGDIFVTDAGSTLGPAVLEYASGATGDVAPTSSLAGTNTGFIEPEGAFIAGPAGPPTGAAVTTSVAATSVSLGKSTSDTATVVRENNTTPTGSLVFKLFGPNDPTCSHPPAYVSPAQTVNGAGNYSSPPFIPTMTGTYTWQVLYSGDGNNAAVTTPCDATGETTTVTSAAPSPCRSGPPKPPHDVVILITGLTSRLPVTEAGARAYDPLSQTYCGLTHDRTSSGKLADLAFMAQNTFDHYADGTIAPVNLTDSLAETGAVLLPFSYDGVSLSGSASKPLYQVASFTPGTPGAVDPQAEADGYLLDLIHEINHVWPNARIQVIGHSEGGFVAEQLFEHQPLSALRNVTRIFSLDSPINGVALASNDWINDICSAVGTGLSQSSCLNIISPALLNLYADRWDQKEPNDRRLIKRDIAEHQIYIPMGTAHDWLYTIADVSTTFGEFVTGVCEGLDTQFLWNDFSFSCYLEDIQNQGSRTPSYLSYVTPDPSSGTPARPGFALKSHEFVMQSADNIKFITQYGPGQYAMSASVTSPARDAEARLPAPPTGQAAASSAPPGALFAQTLTASPFAVLATPFALPGHAFAINGSDLGQAPGQVLFAGARREVAASIQSWSPTQVSVYVPNGAASGPVNVITASGEQLLPGLVAVLATGPGKVHRLAALASTNAVGGDPLRLRVRAFDRHGRPVAGAVVELVGGAHTKRARANRTGVATFTVLGYDDEQFIAIAGNASTTLTARWTRAPAEQLSVVAHKTTSRTRGRASWTVIAHIRNATGRPVAGQVVAFEVLGLPGSRLKPAAARTGTTGTAQTVVSIPRGGAALVEAITNSRSLEGAVTLTN